MKIRKYLSSLRKIMSFLFPHFETNDYAVKRVGRSSIYEILYPMSDVQPNDVCDGIATYTSLCWLWWGFFPTQHGDVRPFVNHRALRPAQ